MTIFFAFNFTLNTLIYSTIDRYLQLNIVYEIFSSYIFLLFKICLDPLKYASSCISDNHCNLFYESLNLQSTQSYKSQYFVPLFCMQHSHMLVNYFCLQYSLLILLDRNLVASMFYDFSSLCHTDWQFSRQLHDVCDYNIFKVCINE